MLLPLLAAGAALLVAGLLTRALLHWSPQRLLDVPNERSSHQKPTLRGGGIAIVAAVLGGVAIHATLAETWSFFMPYLAGGLIIAAVSLLDDIRPLSTAVRLPVHVAAAALVLWFYTRGAGIALPGVPGALAGLLTMIWIVGLTNAYNFMDGIDGLAAAQAVTAGAAWAALGGLVGQPAVALTGALTAGAAAGFLNYNRPPARIFMGDVGSAFLGFTCAALPLMAGGTFRIGLAALCIVGIFVFDTGFTFFRRLTRGENVLQAHRSHLYQRLVRAGRSHGRVTALYSGVAALLGLAGVGVALAPTWWPGVVVPLAVGATVGIWLHVRRLERQHAAMAQPGSI